MYSMAMYSMRTMNRAAARKSSTLTPSLSHTHKAYLSIKIDSIKLTSLYSCIARVQYPLRLR